MARAIPLPAVNRHELPAVSPASPDSFGLMERQTLDPQPPYPFHPADLPPGAPPPPPQPPARQHTSNTNLTAYTFLGLSAALIIAFIVGSTGGKQANTPASGNTGGNAATGGPPTAAPYDAAGAVQPVTGTSEPQTSGGAPPTATPEAQVAASSTAPAPSPSPDSGIASVGVAPPGIGRDVSATYTVPGDQVDQRYHDVVNKATATSVTVPGTTPGTSNKVFGWLVTSHTTQDDQGRMTAATVVVEVPTSTAEALLQGFGADVKQATESWTSGPLGSAAVSAQDGSVPPQAGATASVSMSQATITLTQAGVAPPTAPSHIGAALTVGWDNDMVIISAALIIAMTALPLFLLVTPMWWLTNWGLRRLGLMQPRRRAANTGTA